MALLTRAINYFSRMR